MTAKEWKRRINKAYLARANGDPEPFKVLCEELEALSEPKPAPKKLKAVTPVVTPLPEPIIFG